MVNLLKAESDSRNVCPFSSAHGRPAISWNSHFQWEFTVKTWEKNKNSMSVNYGPLTFSLQYRGKI